jgi:hypothetical protein
MGTGLPDSSTWWWWCDLGGMSWALPLQAWSRPVQHPLQLVTPANSTLMSPVLPQYSKPGQTGNGLLPGCCCCCSAAVELWWAPRVAPLTGFCFSGCFEGCGQLLLQPFQLSLFSIKVLQEERAARGAMS